MRQDPSEPSATFLARLERLQPDLGGTARLDMTDVPRAQWRRHREIVEAHGWTIHTFDYEQEKRYWVLARPGSTAVSREDPYFVTGPSLVELRRHPAARQAAAEAAREFGVDPLSDAALEQTRVQHRALFRKAQWYAGLSACCGMTLLVLLLTAWRPLTEGGTAAIVIGVLDAALLLATVLGGVAATRTLRARAAATRPFTEGYQRVVQAAFHGQR